MSTWSGTIKRSWLLAAVVLVAVSLPASGAIKYIGGVGSVSTSDAPYGELGLLSAGEVATATFGFVVEPTAAGATLIVTVTNTSPAVTGIESPDIPDAPVITDIMFSVPQEVASISFVSAAGVSADLSGWGFGFEHDGQPSSGFGFLREVFDVHISGGPGPGSPNPVIASIYDPDIFDGPGDPLGSPVDFVFDLTFVDGVFPLGFTGDWFCDSAILGNPDYIAAARFISGADGGSGTVTVVPEPASLVALVLGMAGAAAARRRRAAVRLQ